MDLYRKYLFLVGTITKRIFGNYEWTNKAGWERIKDNCISLPVRNGKPDYDIMETFISAVQKLVIKNVVQYTAQKIQKSFELRQESKSLLEKAKQMVEHEIEGTK